MADHGSHKQLSEHPELPGEAPQSAHREAGRDPCRARAKGKSCGTFEPARQAQNGHLPLLCGRVSGKGNSRYPQNKGSNGKKTDAERQGAASSAVGRVVRNAAQRRHGG